MRQFSYAALVAGTMFLTVTEVEAQKRTAPQDARFYVGEPRRVSRTVTKTGPTIVPVVDSNAILNLDYNELRATPAAPSKPVAPVAPPVAQKEISLSELKLKLRHAEDNFKATQLAHAQAVRSKDNTRVEAAVKNRSVAANEVMQLRGAIAVKESATATPAKMTPKPQPAKTTKRKAPAKKTPGVNRNVTEADRKAAGAETIK